MLFTQPPYYYVLKYWEFRLLLPAAICPEYQASCSLQTCLLSAQNALRAVYSCHVSILWMGVLSSSDSAESRCSDEIQVCRHTADKIL